MRCEYCPRPATARETVTYSDRVTVTWTCDSCGFRPLRPTPDVDGTPLGAF